MAYCRRQTSLTTLPTVTETETQTAPPGDSGYDYGGNDPGYDLPSDVQPTPQTSHSSGADSLTADV